MAQKIVASKPVALCASWVQIPSPAPIYWYILNSLWFIRIFGAFDGKD